MRPPFPSNVVFHRRRKAKLIARCDGVELFATPLKPLTTHEGVFSSHGISPSHPIRVPEFLDHLVTALKQAGSSLLSLLFPTFTTDDDEMSEEQMPQPSTCSPSPNEASSRPFFRSSKRSMRAGRAGRGTW